MKTTMDDVREAAVSNGYAAATEKSNKLKPSDTIYLQDLIEKLSQTILKFVELETTEIAILLALWIVQSYRINTFAFCGFLSVQSASPRCGKSRLLEILGCFTDELTPLRTTPTPAVLYRTESRVLFLDEVDNLRNADKEKFGEVMALLCVAFKRGGIVERCNKRSLKVERFDAYRAFGFAGLNALSDALNDRSFPVRMKRTTKKMPRLNLVKLEMAALPLRERLNKWWETHGETLKTLYENFPDETPQLKDLDDRLQDIGEPLLALSLYADAQSEDAGNPITPRFLVAMKSIRERREGSSIEDGLTAFLGIATEQLNGRESVFVASKDLVELCIATDELGWIDNPRRLKSFLKKFDLFPRKQNGKIRGYGITREWVDEWEKRYA
jgi:hypothetical protein